MDPLSDREGLTPLGIAAEKSKKLLQPELEGPLSLVTLGTDS